MQVLQRMLGREYILGRDTRPTGPADLAAGFPCRMRDFSCFGRPGNELSRRPPIRGVPSYLSCGGVRGAPSCGGGACCVSVRAGCCCVSPRLAVLSDEPPKDAVT